MNGTLTVETTKTGLSERMAGGPAAAGRAREHLTALLADVMPADSFHDLLLLTTELVTNAVLHGGVDETRSLDLRVARRPDAVRVAVTDPGGSTSPHMQDIDVSVPGGMGLFLVDQLSARWGADQAGDGSTLVWFELAI
jgi:anti-sigma regulatory factor (Ser/Thr protein kinase)